MVDKMPLNFLLVGLIHLALPNARIIHARRDPFSLLLAGNHPSPTILANWGAIAVPRRR